MHTAKPFTQPLSSGTLSKQRLELPLFQKELSFTATKSFFFQPAVLEPKDMRPYKRKLLFQPPYLVGWVGHVHFVWGLSMCSHFGKWSQLPVSSDRSSCLRIHAAIEATGPSHGPRSFKAPSLVMKDALKGMKGKSLNF